MVDAIKIAIGIVVVAIQIIVLVAAIMYCVKQGRDAKKNYVEVDSMYTKVVGVTFGDIQSVLPDLKSGMSLRFVREPNNKYDSNAIRVVCSWQKIGYLSSDLARDLANIIDNGESSQAK